MMIDCSYLRPKKAAILQEFHSRPFEKRKVLSHPVYENATILPLRHLPEDTLLFGRGGVVDSKCEYVPSSAIEGRVQYAYDFVPPPENNFRDEKVVYCGYFVNHWGHFLIEAVARLWYFLEDNSTVDKYVFFLNENEQRTVGGNYREFFELLGIWDKLEFINTPTRFREVIVPELGYRRMYSYSDAYKAIFMRVAQNIRPQEDWPTARKIYFSRSRLKNARRNELGMDMLDNYFSKNGYLVLYPESLPLSKLIHLMQHAEEIASVSGTLPHNLLFAADGATLLILERNVPNNEIQADINRIKALQVTYLDVLIPLYTVDISLGPCLFAYTDLFDAYTRQRSYLPPDEKYRTSRHLKKLFARYIRAYERTYCYQWPLEDWMISYTDVLREGYAVGFSYFGNYLSGKPFLLRHYLLPCYWGTTLRWITASIRRRAKLLLHIN